MTDRYKMLKDSSLEPRAVTGTVVYRCKGWDYGCANDDTRITGDEHVSVTMKPDGGYPFFTVRKHDLEPSP